jgi:hypothetical protein
MVQQAKVTIDIGSKADTRGFKAAETALNKLNRSVKNVAASLGIAYGTRAVINFGKATVKAFMEDEAAATRLNQVVKNLGLAYASTDIVKYIDKLTLATGVADNQLRPALQSLLQVTGSVTKSQELLATAIDVSRGSGEDLLTVSADLSQAYVGNLKGLRKYYLGLTQAELKAMSFADIQDRLNSTFSGASAAYLETYAGKMAFLANTANEAKEIIGKSLIDALMALGNDTNVKGLSQDILDSATYMANLVGGLVEFKGILDSMNPAGGLFSKAFGLVPDWLKPFLSTKYMIDWFVNLNKSAIAARNTFNFAAGGGMGADATSKFIAQQAAKADAIAKKRQAEILKMARAAAAKAAAEAALKKNNALFDLSQIQLIAALKGKLSDEDRKRAELQLAILQENTSEAAKLAGEVAKAQGMTEDMVKYYMGIPDAKNPFLAWVTTLTDAAQLAADIAKYVPPNISTGGGAGGGTSATPSSIGSQTMSDQINQIYYDSLASGMSAGAAGATARYSGMALAYGAGGTNIVVNVQGSVATANDLVSEIRDGLLNSSLSGKIANLERSFGSFAP